MEKKLSELIKSITVTNISSQEDPVVTSVCYDTRKEIGPGCLFICIKGAKSDSHDFAYEAASKGACAIVAMHDVAVPEGCVVVVTPDTRRALALISAAFFDHPARKLTTIALTGTKGKSTTSYMIRDILEKAGHKCGIIGTIGIAYDGKRFAIGNSTPESYIIHDYFAKMVEAGCDSVVMEVSSQGLMQNRVYGINYDVAVFLNLEQDHIGEGEHSCLEEYLYCKSILFRNCKHAIFAVGDSHLKDMLEAADIIDRLDAEGKRTLERSAGTAEESRERFKKWDERFNITRKSTLTARDMEGFAVEGGANTEEAEKIEKSGGYGSKSDGEEKTEHRASDVKGVFEKCTYAHNLEFTKKKDNDTLKLGIDFVVNLAAGGKAKVSLNIPGRYNVANAAAAIAVTSYLGCGADAFMSALLDFSVCGRLEPVHVSDDFTLYIDYAHNAMALENVLLTLRAYDPGRLVCLFGCGGNRSKERRYTMGEVSSRLADLSVVTSDNPRFEKPADIIEDILIGVKKEKGEYIVIENRREAIDYVIRNGRPGDIILLAGKGNEDYQEICGTKYPFDERVVIAELMQGM
ncbi:MAG: UDP-N-acetylmuramoyl-L-alanyl-D-glutamate--2,6-diaminopimelate ligase [Lachnospiraceae bacterium]|nr:UDP-N-acetylmuramoyl-L-alanyl-D-glutamate--2,6-diaminopimelate ligase [Lachnospiraceae bacterium]